MKKPSPHKIALLTMVGAYPTIVLLLTLLKPRMMDQPITVQAATLVPLMVLLLTYVVMPLLTKLFQPWLDRETSLHGLALAASLMVVVPLGTLIAQERPSPRTVADAPTLDGMVVDHVMVNVSDFERSLAWYRDKLGFTEVVRWTVDGLDDTHLAYLRLDDFLLEIASGPESEATSSLPRATDFESHFAQRGFTHLCFRVDDVDAALRELNQNGVPTFSSPIDFPPLGARVGFVQDPDGNVIEFKGPMAGNSVVDGRAVFRQ